MKAARPKQLSFVFADSPKGGKSVSASDVSKAWAYLLHIAKGMSESDLAASESNASELMERIVSYGNLAAALLKVARNKGAPGVDGRSVEEVVEGKCSPRPACSAVLKWAKVGGDAERMGIRGARAAWRPGDRAAR